MMVTACFTIIINNTIMVIIDIIITIMISITTIIGNQPIGLSTNLEIIQFIYVINKETIHICHQSKNSS